MAKMFYTLDETKAALGQSEDQIKQLTREGRLREFRDGPRLMFKSDQVDALKATIGGGGGEIDFADSGVPLSLADTGGGSGTALSLADTGGSGSGLGSGMGGSGLAGISGSGLGSGLVGGSAGSGMMNLKDDTALAADLGLSGTVGGIPSPGRSGVGSGGTGTGMSGSVGSRQGINVFGDDTHMPVDPMAQTAMPGLGSGASGADLDLQGIGSGSGLLDLTRESDDTSLGAELLDEISPGGSRRPSGPPDTGSMAGVRLEAPRGGVVRATTGGVNVVEAADPWAGAFGGLALGAGLFMLFPLFALITAMYDKVPDSVAYFGGTVTNSDKPPMENPFMILIIVGLVVSALCFAFGKLIQMSARR